MVKVGFECGGFLKAEKAEPHKVGSKLVVFTSPAQGHQRPVCPDDEELRMNCLIMCPCTVKASGRKTERVFFENGTRGFVVTCRVKGFEEIAEAGDE
jgi:hypothetical protein